MWLVMKFSGENKKARIERIAKEVAELENRNAQDISSKSLSDYSTRIKVQAKQN